MPNSFFTSCNISNIKYTNEKYITGRIYFNNESVNKIV